MTVAFLCARKNSLVQIISFPPMQKVLKVQALVFPLIVALQIGLCVISYGSFSIRLPVLFGFVMFATTLVLFIKIWKALKFEFDIRTAFSTALMSSSASGFATFGICKLISDMHDIEIMLKLVSM